MKKNNLFTDGKFAPSYLSVVIALACAASPSAFAAPEKKAGDNIPLSPFAYLSLNLQNVTVVSGEPQVPPNIMLFLDDSGSMWEAADPEDESGCQPGAFYKQGMLPDRCFYPCSIYDNYHTTYKAQNEPAYGGWVCVEQNAWRPKVQYLKYHSPRKYTSRMRATKDAIKKILDNYKDRGYFWALHTLHGSDLKYYRDSPNTSFMQIDINDSKIANNINIMKQNVDKMNASGSTPATREYLKAASKLIDNIDYVCQHNFIVMMSDGDANDEDIRYYRWENYPNSGFYEKPDYWKYSYYSAGKKHGIAWFSHQLRNKDVKPKNTRPEDKDGTKWDGLELVDASGNKKKFFEKQHVTTYTIGFGSGISANGQAYLRDAATPGPKDPDDKINYFTANNAQELTAAFDKIFADLSGAAASLEEFEGFAGSTPSVAPAVSQSVNGVAATVSLDTKTWSSTVQFFTLDSEGKIALGSDGKPIIYYPDYSQRKILVNNGVKTKFMDEKGAFGNEFYGFSDQTKDDFKKYFMRWYQRDINIADPAIQTQAQAEQGKKEVHTYRVRTKEADNPKRMMGDVIDSPVLTLRKDGKPTYLMTASNDGMVYIFKANANNQKHPYSLKLNYLPGAMQREKADNSDTVAKALKATAEEGYGKTVTKDQGDDHMQPHLYLNNGGMQWRETATDKDGHTQTILAGALGQGGRGAYLLNIAGHEYNESDKVGLDADESSWDDSVPLWETEKGINNKLGYTVSTPQIGLVATKVDSNGDLDLNTGVRQFMFLANGYRPGNSAVPYDDQPTLYVYDILGKDFGLEGKKNGTTPPTYSKGLVKKISVRNGFGGLSTPILVDTDQDYLFDHAYAGDQGGNVYRFTMIGDPSTWKVTKIYEGKKVPVINQGIVYPQPITASPAVYRLSPQKYIVVVGTGSDVYQSDLKDKNQQVLLGLIDDLTDDNPGTITQSSLKERNLLTQKIDTPTGKRTVRFINDGNSLDLNSDKGWVLKLPEKTGERVVVKPEVLLSSAFVTTQSYDTKTEKDGNSNQQDTYSCKVSEEKTTASAESWLYAINVKTGGQPDEKYGAYFRDLPSKAGKGGNKSDKNVAGIQLAGRASSPVLFNMKAITKPEYATDTSGGSKSGKDGNLGEPDKRTNECIDIEEAASMKVGVTDEKSFHVEQVGVYICPVPSLLRINLRDVPL